MSRDHYRDMYSARREGVLEPGLAGVFDEELKNDVDLREEYEAFCATCDALDLGAQEEIEAPDWLSARILDRLDTLPTVQSSSPSSWFSLRSLGFAGLGAVALLGAGFAVWRGANGPVSEAGIVPSVHASAGDVLRPVMENGRVYVDFQAVGTHGVGIFAAPDGALLRRFPVQDGQRLHTELGNPWPNPFAFEIRVDRQENPLFVVVPGTLRDRNEATGSGDLIGFAKALARTYGTPVALRVATPKTAVTWNLSGAAGQSSLAQSEALRTMDGLGLSVDTMPGGLLSIQDR